MTVFRIAIRSSWRIPNIPGRRVWGVLLLLPLLAVAIPTVTIPLMAEGTPSNLQSFNSGEDAELPDAPRQNAPSGSNAQSSQSPTAPQNQPAEKLVFAIKDPPRYAKDIDADQTTHPLSARGKVLVSLQEQARLYSLASATLSAGYEHLVNSHPKYGTDSAGFGERLGAAAIRQTSQAVLADGVAASILHQDPRFYRMEHGHVLNRAVYAATRVMVTRGDHGTPQVNASELLGYAGASLLTRTYYPAVSNRWSDTASGYGFSLLGSALGNQVTEFGPGLLSLLLHRKP